MEERRYKIFLLYFRRIYDRQIHARIRQITDKMLKRRLEARGSIFEERRQVKLEVQEVHINRNFYLLSLVHFVLGT
jgi:hypothetical protein